MRSVKRSGATLSTVVAVLLIAWPSAARGQGDEGLRERLLQRSRESVEEVFGERGLSILWSEALRPEASADVQMDVLQLHHMSGGEVVVAGGSASSEAAPVDRRFMLLVDQKTLTYQTISLGSHQDVRDVIDDPRLQEMIDRVSPEESLPRRSMVRPEPRSDETTMHHRREETDPPGFCVQCPNECTGSWSYGVETHDPLGFFGGVVEALNISYATGGWKPLWFHKRVQMDRWRYYVVLRSQSLRTRYSLADHTVHSNRPVQLRRPVLHSGCREVSKLGLREQQQEN